MYFCGFQNRKKLYEFQFDGFQNRISSNKVYFRDFQNRKSCVNSKMACFKIFLSF